MGRLKIESLFMSKFKPSSSFDSTSLGCIDDIDVKTSIEWSDFPMGSWWALVVGLVGIVAASIRVSYFKGEGGIWLYVAGAGWLVFGFFLQSALLKAHRRFVEKKNESGR